MSVINKISLKTPLLTIDLPVVDATPDDRYIVKNVTGLGPPQIDVALGDGLYQGGIYMGSLPQDREIVILVQLNPKYGTSSIEASDLRAQLYSTMAGQIPVRITINTNALIGDLTDYLATDMYVDGYVKSVEISPFSQTTEVQISFICPQSWFIDLRDSSNSGSPATPFVYNATAPTGFIYNFILGANTSLLKLEAISNEITHDLITVTYNLLANDEIYFDSRPGVRQMWYLRVGDPHGIRNLLGYAVVTNNIWPMLRPGSNRIRVYNNSGDLATTRKQFTYNKQYWGV